MRRGKKNRAPDGDDRGWLKYSRGILFSTQIAAENQAAHAMRHDVDLVYRLPVIELQIAQESTERRAEILDGCRSRQAAGVEK